MEPEKISSNSSSPNNNLLPASILVAAILIAGSIFYAFGGSRGMAVNDPSKNIKPAAQLADIKTALAPSDRDVILGDPQAPVTVVEYGDYQCPFCGRFFSQTEPLLKESYVKTNKVRMIYRDMAFLGPESVEASKAAECAKDQGKFWAFHDALFTAEIKDGQEGNGNLNRDLFVKLAGDVKLDTKAFTACYDSGKYADVVQQITDQAHQIGVNATPTTFVNQTMIQGAQPFAQFKATIDQLLGAS